MNINEVEQRILSSFLRCLTAATNGGDAEEMLIILKEWQGHLEKAKKFFDEQKKLIAEADLAFEERAKELAF